MGDGARDALRGYIRAGMIDHSGPKWREKCPLCRDFYRSLTGNFTICEATGRRHETPRRKGVDSLYETTYKRSSTTE